MIDELKSKMTYNAERQKLIASNIANINTPGAKTMDLDKFSFEKTRKRLKLDTTDDKHLEGRVKSKFVPYEPKNTFVKLDGNDISIENESLKMSENTLDHQQTVDVYNKMLGLYRIASQNERK